VFAGSLGSGAGGLQDVFTEQNIQPRVQVSPSIIIVAVATLCFPPPQQSSTFGHRASSHTYITATTQGILYCSGLYQIQLLESDQNWILPDI